MKKVIVGIMAVVLAVGINAQEISKEDFAKEKSNKHYIGINVAPVLTIWLNEAPTAPEWSVLYKGSLKGSNHFLRGAYGYTNLGINDIYSGLIDYQVGFNNYFLNDSVEVINSKFVANKNIHTLKFGYEYQIKLGKQKRLSLNVGADALLALINSVTRYYSDTLLYPDGIDPWNTISLGNSSIYETGEFRVGYGFSPFLSLGVPIRKRFDITFSMAFDTFWQKPELHVRWLNMHYRPAIMLSYNF